MVLFQNILTQLELKCSQFICRHCGKTFIAHTPSWYPIIILQKIEVSNSLEMGGYIRKSL